MSNTTCKRNGEKVADGAAIRLLCAGLIFVSIGTVSNAVGLIVLVVTR